MSLGEWMSENYPAPLDPARPGRFATAIRSQLRLATPEEIKEILDILHDEPGE